MTSETADPSPTADVSAADCHAAAAAAERTLSDLGLPVRRIVERTTFGTNREHVVTQIEQTVGGGSSSPRPDPESPGVNITVVEEYEEKRPPFLGVCVEWVLGSDVREMAADALQDLMDQQDGAFVAPDVLPEPITRQGQLHEIMQAAIRSALAVDGIATRDDSDYRPFGLWLVLRKHLTRGDGRAGSAS